VGGPRLADRSSDRYDQVSKLNGSAESRHKLAGADHEVSNANRQAAGVVTGEEVEVEVEIDAEPRVVVEPADFAKALDADPVARTAYDRLSYGRKREHVLAIESAKRAETRRQRIEKALVLLRDQ
jgi:hypothetical protein